jgi:NADH dehydrogenase FAD-containing subunit
MASNEKETNSEPLNVIILGASFAGLAIAHKFMRQVMETLGKTRSAPRYRLILVSPSECLYWNIGAPRAIVSEKFLALDDVFVPFGPLFEDYPSTRFQFIQGKATAVNFETRMVVVDEVSKNPVTVSQNGKNRPEVHTQQLLKFHALVVATGTSAESKLLSLHGPHERTVEDIQNFRERLKTSASIIVAGGGPSGCECAGQLATWLNRGKKPAQPSTTRPPSPPKASDVEAKGIKKLFKPKKHSAIENNLASTRKTIILVHKHDRLLPKLAPRFGAQAEAKLNKLGVQVIHNCEIKKAVELPSGRTQCMIGEDLSIQADTFIGATGVHPNTSFMPTEMLTASKYINADPKSLRLPGISRAWAVGDCASHSKNSIQDVYDSVPILLRNLQNDLIAWEYQKEYPRGGTAAEDKLQQLEDFEYVQNPTDSQLMPISRFGGVGILFGKKIPSFMVWLMKGRDYRKERAKSAAGVGKDPYAVI